MLQNHISIIGLGVAEKAALSSEARCALFQADLVVGSERQFRTIQEILTNADRQPETKVLPKLSDLKALVENEINQQRNVAVLASGDPLFYGIGKWFINNFPSQVQCFPAVSSVQVACHRLGISLQDVTVLSLHGRPIEKLRTKLAPNTILAILTDKNSNPRALASECAALGFGAATITVCENLGYESEVITTFIANDLVTKHQLKVDPLHVTFIQTGNEVGRVPTFPGIPDTDFYTGREPGKGMISKREVRLAILSYLQPCSGDVIWDIGAGCGGVAIELALWNDSLQVHAIEHHPERIKYLTENQRRFGVVSNMNIVAGRAPECLSNLPNPNKVFVGGSDGELEQLLSIVWNKLPPGGVLVASAVLEGTKQQLCGFAESLDPMSVSSVESVELAVKRGSLENGLLTYKPKLPVEIFRFIKSGNSI